MIKQLKKHLKKNKVTIKDITESENKINIEINYSNIRNKKIKDESFNNKLYEYIRYNIIEYIESESEYKLTYESMNYKTLNNQLTFRK